MRSRLIAGIRLVVLIGLEAAAIPLLRGRGQGGPAGIDWSHLGPWLTNAAPDDAVIAVVRLAALGLAAWLLATTVLYLLARVTRVPPLVRSTSWATLPAIRRMVDAAVAASLMGSAVLAAHPAGAQVPGPPPIVVELDTTTTTAPLHRYVPVPAGDRAAPVTTTAVATTTPPSPTTTPPPPPASRIDSAPPAGAEDLAAHLHTVVPGDNLWTIAAAELSRQTGRTPDHLAEVEIRNYWITVIEANRAHLRSGDPNLIYPGESIVCPPIA